MSAWREGAIVVVACLVAYLTGLRDLPLYTRGEPREGLVAREMLRTGSWLVPARPEGEIARKPPLYYWMAAPALQLLPDSPELALRLPSVVLGTAAVTGAWAVTRALAGPMTGLLAGLVLATAFEWTRASTTARVDMALAAPLTAVLAAWMLVLAGRSRRWLALAAAGATLAALAKGPVALVIPALAALGTALALRDSSVLRRLGVVPVLATAAVGAGVWYGIAFAEQGRAFFDVVVKENLVRFIDTDDARTGHAHGMFYLPLLGLVGFLPWIPLLPLVRTALGRERSAPLVLAAVWALVVLVFFSLANAKRSVYLLPAFPAVAILVAAGAARGDDRVARGAAMLYLPALALLAAVACALAGGVDPGALLRPWLKPDDAHGATAVAGAAHGAAVLVAGLGVATLGCALAIESARRAGAWSRAVLLVAGIAVAWTAVFDAVIHPAIGRTRSLADFMMTVDRLVPQDAALEVSFPADPGLRFYAPRRLVQFRAAGAGGPRYVLWWEDEWRRWRDSQGQELRPLAVSEARQARHGPLTLVVAPAEGLRAVGPPAAPRTDSRPR